MAAVEELATGALQELARKHLWMHFTRMGAFDEDHEIPIIVRGDGCYVYDQHGRRYLDGLSALYCVNIGHGRADVAQAGADQAKELGFFTNWGYAHPKAIELAARDRRPRARRPEPRLLHVGRLGGRRLGAQALPPVPQAHRQPRPLQGHRAQARLPRHDDGRAHRDRASRTRGGRSSRCSPAPRTSPNTNPYRPEVDDPAEAIRERIEFEGPETVSCVILEPVQNSGGCFAPPARLLPARARDLRRVRDPVHLRRGDLLLGPARRVLRRRAFGYEPDIITTAKGLTSSYAPMGAVIASDRCSSRSPQGTDSFLHGHHVRRAPGLRGRRARQPRRVRATRGCSRTCAPTRARSARCSTRCATSRSSATCAAWATSGRSSWSRDRETKETFSDDECEWLLRGFLSARDLQRGLICRADDRGDPVIQLSPPLIAGPEQFEEIRSVAAARARGGLAEARPA